MAMNDQLPATTVVVKEKSRIKKLDTNNGSSKRVFICKYCDSEYTQKTNLYRHIRQLHKRKGNAPPGLQHPEYFTCSTCQDKFKTKSLLSFHEALLHPIRRGKLVIPCPLCAYSGSKGELLGHYRSEHNVQIEIEENSFDSALDFYVWKSNLERSTHTQYAKRQKHHVLVNGVIIDMLYCHRDGFYRPEGKNLRNAKLKGTNKINGYCPAFMRVMTCADERVSVLFLKTHFGHDYEIDRLALTRSERDSVASKIALGLSFDDILSELHSSKQERLRIMTKKDLYNIEVSYNLSSVRGRHVKFDNINLQHQDALKVPSDFVSVENNHWTIRSISKEDVTYTVEPVNSDCDISKCILRCKFCQCCGHYYRCSCTENIPLFMMCKHKHVAHLTIKDPQVIIQTDCIAQDNEANCISSQNHQCNSAEELLVSDHIPTSSVDAITESHDVTESNLGQSLLLDNCPQLTTLVIQDLPDDTALFLPTENSINARKAAIRAQLAGILQAVESSELEEELHLIQTLLEPISQTVQSMKEPEEIIAPDVIQPVCKQLRLDDETAAHYFSTTTGNEDNGAQIISTTPLQSTVIDEHNNPILITYTLNQPDQ